MRSKRTASWHLLQVIFFSLFSLSATELIAVSTLTGQVFGKHNNPLAYVQVILEPISRGDVTDESGKFQIGNLLLQEEASQPVIPVEAGIQCVVGGWIPACAGMTASGTGEKLPPSRTRLALFDRTHKPKDR